MIPWENRVAGGVDLSDRSAAPADYAFWSRFDAGALPDDPAALDLEKEGATNYLSTEQLLDDIIGRAEQQCTVVDEIESQLTRQFGLKEFRRGAEQTNLLQRIGCLCCDSSKIFHIKEGPNFITHLGFIINFPGFF